MVMEDVELIDCGDVTAVQDQKRKVDSDRDSIALVSASVVSFILNHNLEEKACVQMRQGYLKIHFSLRTTCLQSVTPADERAPHGATTHTTRSAVRRCLFHTTFACGLDIFAIEMMLRERVASTVEQKAVC